jgi:sodium/hydrogen antiporter
MAITVSFISLVGVFVMGLPVGVAILLGAILGPTDFVLASDVQVINEADRDWMRFGLTGEAGLNDGPAFPSSCLA